MIARHVVLFSSLVAVFAKECDEHFAEGHIPSTSGTFLCRKSGSTTFFATVYDTKLHCPKFSAYKMMPAQQKNDKYKRKGFILDPDVSSDDQAHYTDAPFKDRNIDIGHLAPSNDFSWDTSDNGAWEHTYMMTNVAPQGKYFNEHPWAYLERDTREFSMKNNVDLYVITGVIQASTPNMSSGDAIPDYYYKAVCDLKSKKSFVSLGTNNEACKECGVSTLYPVSKVQSMLGYTLFPASCNTGTVDKAYWDFSSSDAALSSTPMNSTIVV